MNILDRPQDKSPNYGPALRVCDYLVMHATASGFQSAYDWLRNPNATRLVYGESVDARVSAHYLIDKPGTIYHLVDEGQQAWHAGLSRWHGTPYLNRCAIGIELVNLNDGVDPYPSAQYQAALELAKAICQRHAIPIDRQHILAHYEISPGRKTDPRGFPMDKFVRDVYALVYRTAPIVPVDVVEWYMVTPSNGIRIRTAPNTTSTIVATLARGTRVAVDELLTQATKRDCEEVVRGDSRWLHLADGRGFVYARYMQRVT